MRRAFARRLTEGLILATAAYGCSSEDFRVRSGVPDADVRVDGVAPTDGSASADGGDGGTVRDAGQRVCPAGALFCNAFDNNMQEALFGFANTYGQKGIALATASPFSPPASLRFVLQQNRPAGNEHTALIQPFDAPVAADIHLGFALKLDPFSAAVGTTGLFRLQLERAAGGAFDLAITVSSTGAGVAIGSAYVPLASRPPPNVWTYVDLYFSSTTSDWVVRFSDVTVGSGNATGTSSAATSVLRLDMGIIYSLTPTTEPVALELDDIVLDTTTLP